MSESWQKHMFNKWTVSVGVCHAIFFFLCILLAIRSVGRLNIWFSLKPFVFEANSLPNNAL